jgi:hypothetical protein
MATQTYVKQMAQVEEFELKLSLCLNKNQALKTYPLLN